MTVPVALGDQGIEVYAKPVEQTLDRLYQNSEHNPEKFFENLYRLLTWPRLLAVAAIKILGNSGAYTPGIDSVTKGVFLRTFSKQIEIIRTQLLSLKGYHPDAIVRRYIPKKDGRKRPLGIPTIRDRVVQEAVRMILEPIFEPTFDRSSHGFRVGHGVQDCRRDIMPYIHPSRKTQYVLEGDITGFFDNVDHKITWNLLGKKIHDRRLRTLIYRFLKAEIVENDKAMKPGKGMPQGGVISPLLSNIYLNELDRYVEGVVKPRYAEKIVTKRDGQTWRRYPDGGSIGYVRYADDWVLLWNGRKEELVKIKAELGEFLKSKLKLELSEAKTALSDVEDGFNFVGFKFQRRFLSISVKGVDKNGSVLRVKYPVSDYLELNRRKCYTEVTRTFREATVKGYGPDYVILRVNQITSGFMNHYADITFATRLHSRLFHHVCKQMCHYLERRGVKPKTFIRRVDGRLTYGCGKYYLIWEPTREKNRHNRVKRGLTSLHGSRFKNRTKMGKKGRWYTNDPIFPLNSNWRQLRNEVMDRDQHKCVYCGKQATEVHHKFTKKEARHDKEVREIRDKTEYLVSICPSCHLERHGKKWSWSYAMEYIDKINRGVKEAVET